MEYSISRWSSNFHFFVLIGNSYFCANRFAWDICLLPALKKKCKPNLFFDNIKKR